MTTRAFASAALAAAFVACGGADGSNAPEQATVRGTLAQSQSFGVPGPVSFALQWMGAAYSDPIVNDANRAADAPDPEYVSVCETVVPVVSACNGTPTFGEERCRITDVLATALLEPVRYDAHFPISYALGVQGPPPAAALYDLRQQGGSGVYAMGTLLAFVDSNRDGKIQLGTPGVAGEPGLASSAYQDYVPAEGSPRRSYFVTYLRGAIRPDTISAPYAEVLLHLPQGYGIWMKDEWVDAYGRRVAVTRSAQPIETPIALVSRPGIEDSAIWCSSSDVDARYLPSLPAGEVPLFCWEGGLRAEWYRYTTVAPCTQTEERYIADFTCTSTTPPWSSSCPGT